MKRDEDKEEESKEREEAREEANKKQSAIDTLNEKVTDLINRVTKLENAVTLPVTIQLKSGETLELKESEYGHGEDRPDILGVHP